MEENNPQEQLLDMEAPLSKVLQDTFGKDNFVEGNNCDLGAILYRLHFESYLLIPHKKEDVIKLFESTKSLLPGQYQTLTGFWAASIKRKFDWDFVDIYDKPYNGEIYEEMNKFVKQIFIEKGVLRKDSSENNKIVLENQVDNNYNSELTLEDVKIMVCSKFKIGDYGITKQKFRTLIPSKIDNQYYLIWLLEFYRCENDQYSTISKENFIFCVRRYKFIGSKDFNDFCFYIGKCTAYDKIRFDVDCVNALLDAYGDCKYTGPVMLINNEGNVSGFDKDYIIDYMNGVIKNVKDQNLVNKISQKFGIKLDIGNKVNSDRDTNLSASKNEDRQCLDKQANDKNKTPLWLIIITLGGVFWVPWLFNKMFGCCYSFDGNNTSTDKSEDRKILSQNSIPNQDNSREGKRNNKGNKKENNELE